MNYTPLTYEQWLAAATLLAPFGWTAADVGSMRFWRGGLLFDLSAADLGQQERIYSQRLFLIDTDL